VSALRGSLTYARFYVQGNVPDDFRERFMRSIRLRAMRPLEPDDEELERSGWCKIGEPFATDLAYEDVFFNAFVNLGFRTDKWALPGSLVRRHLKEAEEAYLQKKGRERLSRREKTELKILVGKKLRKNTAPATRMVDLSWSLDEGLVRFFGHAPKPGAAMMELFSKTFGLTLVPESPYTLAARIGLSKAQERAWQDLEPVVLASDDAAQRRIDDAAEEEEEES
jgi:hypothetical protein